ncbi:hypothetical protein PDIG_30340 [Penicillium digitatum PHI26]|uniref:Uncharacterized protein n=2 Tax=Penicillium digitatum TaxID=36651 RepID=K9FZ36_PEND2|nr:hypothetical protein PDIP_64720 [Penicillium digitatum Pd1]EKV09390.1 hypothetical protein PDIP_64720 [Penicillium digitatum Pd1]EKV14955.1 hypothetical protein PDIG_30340 [Penicillium digitatum PHI26]
MEYWTGCGLKARASNIYTYKHPNLPSTLYSEKECFLISQSGQWSPQTRKIATYPWNWLDASHVIKSQSEP